jgi:hypothetical protein
MQPGSGLQQATTRLVINQYTIGMVEGHVDDLQVMTEVPIT